MTNLSLRGRVLTAAIAMAFGTPVLAQQPPASVSPSIQVPLQSILPNNVPTQIGPQTAQLWANGISYEPANSFSEPFIQPDLRVGYRFNYKFTFNLKARQMNGKMKSVPDGWYLFTLALLLKDTSRLYNRVQPADVYERFITAASPTLVLVSGGELSVPVTLRFDGLTPTAMSNLLFAELLPLKEKCEYSGPTGKSERPCVRVKENGKPDAANSDVTQLLPGFRPYLAQISFIPFKNKDATRPLIDDDSNPFGAQTLASYVVEARKVQATKRLLGTAPVLNAQQFAEKNGLHYVDLGDAEMAYVGKRFLKDTTPKALIASFLDQTGIQGVTAKESQRRIMSVFCEMLMRKNAQYRSQPIYPMMIGSSVTDTIRACGFTQSAMITLSRNTHVGKVDTTKPVQISMNPQLNYSVNNNFILARTRSRDSVNTGSASPVKLLKPLVNVIESFGVGFPFEATHSISVSNAQTKAEMVMTNMNEVMHFDPLGLVFTGANTQTCLQVIVQPRQGSPFYDTTPGAKNGLYVCAPVKASSQLEEIYAHVFTNAQDSSIVRAFEPGTQTLNASLRGDRDLSAFFLEIRNNIKPVHSPEIFPNASPAMAEALFARPMAYPGIISSPVNFERDWKMSLVQAALMQHRETFMDDQASN